MAPRPTARTPRKIFHKIGEVCELTQTPPYVLRHWESEFPFLAPEKNRAGQRIYSEDDIQMVVAIKRLLYDEGYTTAGARRRIEKEMLEKEESASSKTSTGSGAPAPVPAAAPAPAVPDAESGAMKESLRVVRDGLREIHRLLSAEGEAEGAPAASPGRGRPPARR